MLQSTKVVNIFFIWLALIAACRANNNLQTKYEWKQIDFVYENETERQEAIDSQAFIPANVIPVGIDVHENRLFVSLPRLKNGVPATLATIDMNQLTEATPASPALKPYPSWQAHNMISESDKPDIVSPFHIKVDKCNRLWVLDTGIDSMLNGSESRRLAPVRILIYDLRTDNLLRQHDLAVLLEKSVFSNIAVDDNDCEDEFAYIADAGTPPSISVYSWKSDSTWVVKHNFFNIDPLAGNFSVLGTNYRTSEGVYGLALSEKKANGYPDLYFHPLTSTHEFNVSTAVLRNWKTDGANSYKEFTIIGDRGTNAQAGASVFDKESGVVFYALPNMNEIACWRTANQNYSIMNGNVFSSPTKMVYPIDVKIDAKDRLWVLSNNMQQFLNGKLDMNNPNFFVHVVAVKEAIKNTACERGFIEKVVNKFNKALGKDGKSASNGMKPAAFITFIGSIWLWAKHMF